MKKISFMGVILSLLLFISACTSNTNDSTNSSDDTGETTETNSESYSLDFNGDNFTEGSITVDGETINYRAYEKVVYVQNPVDITYQVMNIYVPDAYINGETIGTYSAETAPIFFPNDVGGYMPAEPGSPGESRGSGSNAIAVALSKGYVVASPGARGRTLQNEVGEYTGKAPAAIVDLKAAVRYLRYNDENMAGDAEKIISNGTSAGGALSSLLGATGNNAEYEPYLQELGAADEEDHIYAVSAYTPIVNLENASMAYEWQLSDINTYTSRNIDWHVERPDAVSESAPESSTDPTASENTETPNQPPMGGTGTESTLTEEQIKVSEELKTMFPEYVNSLNLISAEGATLMLDEQGDGSFKEYIMSLVMASGQKALDSGTDMSTYTWLTIENGKVVDIDYDAYLNYLGRTKTPPAFDALDLSSGENDLFGTESINAQHFTQYSYENSTANGTLADEAIVKMMNPMEYIGTEGSDTSQFWRIRFGTKDSDTSIAIPTIMATTLQMNNIDVDYALAWDQPHSGDYDLEELFAWMNEVVAAQ